MSSVSLLDIQADKLFEKYNVSEIEDIQKSLNKELEHKKEELRTLVGERYRDLIEAADTIADMKVLSEQVIDNVEGMTEALGALQRKHLSGIKPNKPDLSSAKHSVLDEVASQVKILVDLPEAIWKSIDRKDYFKAVLFFLFGRHIKTGFQVDKNLKKLGPEFIVLERLWCSFSDFPSLIARVAENDLKQTDLNPEDCCLCLVSIAFLENISPASKFLSIRTEALQNILKGSDKIKERILGSHDIVLSTVFALHHCFLDGGGTGKGSVWNSMQKISHKDSPPVLSYLQPNISFKYLPSIITLFRAKPISKIEVTCLEEIQTMLQNWLKFVKDYLNDSGKIILKNVSMLQSLHSLTNITPKVHTDWAKVLESFGIFEPLNLWNDVYKPIINNRAKELITSHWEEAFSHLKQLFTKVLKENVEDMPELDMRWYIWKESTSDLDLKSGEYFPRGLWLKAKGISPKVTNMCNIFQTTLETLYNDVSAVCYNDDVVNEDSKDLRSHHQNACLDIILRLKEFVRDILHNESTNETTLAIIARFLQSVPELCPALQKCLTVADENKMNSWHEAKTLLTAESLSCWSYWEENMVKRYMSIISNYMKVPDTYAELLEIIPQWDMILIKEGEENDKIHESQLKIPSSPSLPLQSLLYKISSDVSQAHIPRLIYENVMQKMVQQILENYPTTVLCQAQSLQYLLDFKFLLALFIPTTNRDLHALCQERIELVESKVDPFDLDVFSPHIHNNVKMSILRLQGLFGMTVYISDSGPSVKVSEDPCIIALSKSSPNAWFPSLPVTNPANRPVKIMKTKPSLSSGKQASNSENEMIYRGGSAASSFFTDWFS